MIVFENEGLIDLKAVTTFGVSVKETDNPIGYFGTGLKYAIAVLLRNNQEVSIWLGDKEYRFGVVASDFRGQEFQFVSMCWSEGCVKELGFTTELGKNWELWQAYRELWCNTKDENGDVYLGNSDDSKKDGFTRVEVTGQEFEEVHENRNTFILTGKTVCLGVNADAHLGTGKNIFYKGIAVYEHRKPARYDYNLTCPIELTEDRTLKHQWRAQLAVMSLILSSPDEKFVENALTVGTDGWEHDLNFMLSGMHPSETFMAVVRRLRENSLDTNRNLNPAAVELHREHSIRNILPDESATLSKVQLEQLNRAKLFVSDVLGADMNRYPIYIMESLGPGHLGRAIDGKIYVSKRAFDMGTKWVAAALYEEYIHLSEGVEDESHAQKIIYLEKILTLGEALNGKPL